MVEALVAKFIQWISPFLVPVLLATTLLFGGMYAVDQVRINGFGFTVPYVGWQITFAEGYKSIVSRKDSEIDTLHGLVDQWKGSAYWWKNAADNQTAAYKKLQAQRQAHDNNTNNALQPKVDALNRQLAGKDDEINKLKAMVGDPKYGATPSERAKSILGAAYPIPGAAQ